MKLSIVIPAYNEEAYLGECLRHVIAELDAHRDKGPFEVIVIDNASTDRTAEIAGEFPEVRVVHEPKKGLTRARQRGLEEARGEVLAYIDADTRMPKDWLGRVLAQYDRHAELVCVSGPYVYYDLSIGKRALVRLYWALIARPTYLITHYMVVGGNFAASRAALIGIGGFDTSIEFYGEDTNIARRLHAAGDVVFDMRLEMETSARRLNAEGFLTIAVRYAMNYAWEAILKRPLTNRYVDTR
jgi:glycosyltransferase involved in cell wall biosynthesis